MKRNELTTAKELKPGDRFYKLRDKSKAIYQSVQHAPRSTKYKHYAYWCCPVKFAGGQYEDQNTVAIDGGTEVVFLRHKD